MEYEERTRIATPEGVELELVLAGLASRFIAELFDALILGAVLVAMLAVAALAGGGAGAFISRRSSSAGSCSSPSPTTSPSRCWRAVAPPASAGRACGWCSRAAGRSTCARALVRNLIRLIEGIALFYVPAIVAVLATRRNQRLGDLAAGTLVIREPGRAAYVPGRPRPRSPRPPPAGTSPRSPRTTSPRSARSSPAASTRAGRAPPPGPRLRRAARAAAPASAGTRPARSCSRGSPPRSGPDPEYSKSQSTVRSAPPMSDPGSTSTPAPGWSSSPRRPPTPGRGRARAPGSGGASRRGSSTACSSASST